MTVLLEKNSQSLGDKLPALDLYHPERDSKSSWLKSTHILHMDLPFLFTGSSQDHYPEICSGLIYYIGSGMKT